MSVWDLLVGVRKEDCVERYPLGSVTMSHEEVHKVYGWMIGSVTDLMDMVEALKQLRRLAMMRYVLALMIRCYTFPP